MLPGGGDIGELLRRLGPEALESEAESAGLSPRARRLRCPWPGCEHKGAERERDAVILAQGGHYRVYCHACQSTGDLIDLLQRTRGLSQEEAIAHVRGVPVSEKPRPELRVVGSRPPDEDGKLTPAEVKRVWDALAHDDERGRAYLEKRGLGEAVDLGLVRFVGADTKEKSVASHGRRGYQVAALLSDVMGSPRGVQIRFAGEPKGNDPKIISVKGSVTSRAFFGTPGGIDQAAVVAVAEGLADSLALQVWAGEGAVVAGAAGKSFIPKLAEELEAAGIAIEGKLFALFPQNDEHASRREFNRLKQLLHARGARTCWVETPGEFKDVAEWRRAKPEGQWPPREVAEAFGDAPGDDQERTRVLPDGLALPMPRKVETERYAQNFTTLVALLDDASTRIAIIGTGDPLTWCEMTGQPKVGGRELNEADVCTVRLGLEGYARSTDGKPLQFKETDIEKAIAYIAKRTPVHAIRAELEAFPTWDGTPRLEAQLPRILGHEAGTLEARLLRRWMVSAVARIMQPGCQVDTVLILTGSQGAGKTSFFRHLGGRWTTSSKVQPGDEEGMMVMRQFWFIEWGELSSMKARSREMTKDFITNPIDTFRWPWGRRPVSAPRHSVLVGTTNDKEILEDPTGNRRYWPIEVRTSKIDLAWLDANRTQLFAEALALFRGSTACPACVAGPVRCADHRWWLTDDEESLLKSHQSEFETDPHPWFDVLAGWIEETQPTSLTTAQILQYGVDQKVEHFKPISNNQIADLMERLGWTKARADGRTGKRIWVRKGALL